MTPNSFSDRGKFLDEDSARTQLKSFLSQNNLIIDVGFESTAPMNSAITNEEEWTRFKSFLVLSKEFSFEGKVLSLDTYKSDNFIRMARAFKEVHPGVLFIWNDVSGVLDESLWNALAQIDCFYVYNSTHIPSRDLVLNHMSFLNKADSVESTIKNFQRAKEAFKKRGWGERLILDPGFGFSKTFEQNWQLINRFNEVLSHISRPMVIGLSKKSFLRKALQTESFEESEHLHFHCLVNFMKIQGPHRLYRVHDPRIVELVHTFAGL